MGHLDQLILDMALIMAACTVMTLIFRKARLPLVLGYILAGFLISPHFTFLPTVVNREDVSVWADIGVIFLMFGLGLEFSFKKIAEVGQSAFITALTVMGGMWVIGTVLGAGLGLDHSNALFLGAMMALSSTMVIMKTFQGYGIMEQQSSGVVMGALVIEDIGGIFMMIILSALCGGGSVSAGALFLQILQMLLFLAVWLVLGIYIIPTILRKTGRLMNSEVLLIFSVAVCFVMVVIASRIGFSDALGAFMGGSILAGTIRGAKIEKLVKPLKDLFGAIFFVSVGMMIVPEIFVSQWKMILIITVVVVFGQIFFSTLGILFSGSSFETAVKGGLSMMQIGEFSFIIAALGMNMGVLDEQLYRVIVIVAVITIFLTPFSVKNSGKIYSFVERIVPDRFIAFTEKYAGSRKTSKRSDNDWNRYLKSYMINTGICLGMLAVIYIGSVHVLSPALKGVMSETAAQITGCALTVIAMIIPTAIVANRRTNLFLKLWFTSMANRLPLTVLATVRELLCAVFLMLAVRKYFAIPWWIIGVIAAVLMIVVVRLDVIRRGAFRIRAGFIANLNEKTRHRRIEQEKDDWFYNKIWVAEMRAGSYKDGRQILDMYESRLFDMRVIKVVRGKEAFLMPSGDFRLDKDDILHIIGTKDRIDAYRELLRGEDNEFEDYSLVLPLKKYIEGQDREKVPPAEQIMCAAVNAEEDSDFTKKTIRDSGIRERYNAFIIGIDRAGLPIVVENLLDLTIQKGDTIWVIGTHEMAQKLLDDELLDDA